MKQVTHKREYGIEAVSDQPGYSTVLSITEILGFMIFLGNLKIMVLELFSKGG